MMAENNAAPAHDKGQPSAQVEDLTSAMVTAITEQSKHFAACYYGQQLQACAGFIVSDSR